MTGFLRTLLLAGAAVSSAVAANVSFTGSFTTDDQLQLIYFNIATTGPVTLTTLSYGGGTNSASASISPGGFDPRLTWFQADGTEVGSDNGGHCGSTATYLSACNDAYFSGTLNAGSYILALTEDGNDPIGDLSDGFNETGMGDFTTSFGVTGCTAFCDSPSNSMLNGQWAVDILSVDSATETTTPEPLTFVLTGGALSLLALTRRRRTN
jgi:uncharacterized protein (TIGR03382 family)